MGEVAKCGAQESNVDPRPAPTRWVAGIAVTTTRADGRGTGELNWGPGPGIRRKENLKSVMAARGGKCGEC